MGESPRPSGPRLQRKHLRVLIGLSAACFGIGTVLAALRRPAAFVLLLAGFALLLVVALNRRR